MRLVFRAPCPPFDDLARSAAARPRRNRSRGRRDLLVALHRLVERRQGLPLRSEVAALLRRLELAEGLLDRGGGRRLVRTGRVRGRHHRARCAWRCLRLLSWLGHGTTRARAEHVFQRALRLASYPTRPL